MEFTRSAGVGLAARVLSFEAPEGICRVRLLEGPEEFVVLDVVRLPPRSAPLFHPQQATVGGLPVDTIPQNVRVFAGLLRLETETLLDLPRIIVAMFDRGQVAGAETIPLRRG